MRKDGQTDKTKLIVAFRNFANAPKSPKNKLKRRDCLYIQQHLGTSNNKTVPVTLTVIIGFRPASSAYSSVHFQTSFSHGKGRQQIQRQEPRRTEPKFETNRLRCPECK